jgi:hypothetical protein
MSLACAQKTNICLEKTEVPYLIIAPQGQVVADCMVPKISLELAGRILPTNLLILEGPEIDIILWMRWIKIHKALLDISTWLVHLDSPVTGKVTLHLSAMAHLQAFVHTTVAKSLEEIHIFREYPDMFPNVLPGMPPDKVVEFNIELQPSTAPISKRLYWMPPNELAELKIQLP